MVLTFCWVGVVCPGGLRSRASLRGTVGTPNSNNTCSSRDIHKVDLTLRGKLGAYFELPSKLGIDARMKVYYCSRSPA